LQALVRDAGFTIERRRRPTLNGRVPGTPEAAGDDVAVIAVAIALLPVCIVLSVLEALAGHGAVVELWARPTADEADTRASAHAP
jgi:hypothetical protein